ncbi:MAG: hypothetical protein QOD09_4824 [Bradyrhizobium sp.]|jgi:hypothetical protein|nr:hypothetical protein [Bradyrhizobium sp.]
MGTTAPPTAVSYTPRVVVKFAASTTLPYSAQAQAQIQSWPGNPWADLLKKFPGVSISPYFNPSEKDALTELQHRASTVSGQPSPRLLAYYVIPAAKVEGPYSTAFAAELVQASGVAAMVSGWPQVEIAYVEISYSGPQLLLKQTGPFATAPPVPNFPQGYRSAAPVGIDAAWVHDVVKLDGTGTRIVDLENGWLLNHEDLPHNIPKIGPGLDSIIPGHGAAVLGILVGRDNNSGVIGIAPQASIRVVSQCFEASGGFVVLPAAAIYLALRADMQIGDILLLETASVVYDPKLGSVPVETQALVFDLIRTATDLGITVVAPAGTNFKVDAQGQLIWQNGFLTANGQNLDDFRDSNNKAVLDRASPEFKDSGAILVGAGGSVDRERLTISNNGSRVDCYAWGDSIVTCGDGWSGLAQGSKAPEQTYTSVFPLFFGGTSGAAAIVAGAALLLQSLEQKAGGVLNPSTMRARLTDPGMSTPSKTPATDLIGVMPNLRANFIQMNAPDLTQWSASIRFALGHKGGDGDQWYWTPGGGLRHVGPWGPDGPVGPNTHLTAARRDALIGLVLKDFAGLLSDPAAQRAVNDAVAKLLPARIGEPARPVAVH